MKLDEVRKRAFAMPLTSRFSAGTVPVCRPRVSDDHLPDRSDRARSCGAVATTFDDPLVKYEFILMPIYKAFGDYTELGQVIPVKFRGQEGGYCHAMFLNDGPPIYGGRELWGFPKKYAQPSLSVDKDTLIGTLDYGPVRVATATMGFKHKALDLETVRGPYKAELFAQDYSACRRQPSHTRACRLSVGRHRHEGRLDRPGGA